MENKKIYVISMSSGSYDSYSSIVVGVTDDFEKAEEYVNHKNKLFESMNQKVIDFYNNEYVKWHADNPRPNILVKGLIDVPKWKSDQKITKEMRDQRKELELKNSQVSSKAHEPLLQWSNNLQNYCKDSLRTKLTEEEFDLYFIRNENQWSMEEANWI